MTTKYLVDDLTPTGYSQVAEEIVSGAVTSQYTYGRVRISQRRSGTLSYYGYDGGGSVRQLFDNTGAVTDSYAYDGFGNTVAQTGSTTNEFLYRGEQYDVSLRLYYLRVRYYRPQVGRFLTQDTYEGQDEEPPSLHKYLYTNADPVDGIDPTGHTFRGFITALLSGPIAVIGKFVQTSQIRCPYCDVLNVPNFTPEIEGAWLQAIINGRRLVIVVSSTNLRNLLNLNTMRFTWFGFELDSLIQAGFTSWWIFYIPPIP